MDPELIQACRDGNCDKIKELNHRCDNIRCHLCYRLVRIACYNKQLEVIKMIQSIYNNTNGKDDIILLSVLQYGGIDVIEWYYLTYKNENWDELLVHKIFYKFIYHKSHLLEKFYMDNYRHHRCDYNEKWEPLTLMIGNKPVTQTVFCKICEYRVKLEKEREKYVSNFISYIDSFPISRDVLFDKNIFEIEVWSYLFYV